MSADSQIDHSLHFLLSPFFPYLSRFSFLFYLFFPFPTHPIISVKFLSLRNTLMYQPYDIWYMIFPDMTVIVYTNVPASYLKCNPSAYTAVLSEQLYSLEVSFSDPIKWYFCVCECGSLKISRFKYLYLYFMRIQTVFENSIWTDPTQFLWTDPIQFFRNVHNCMTTQARICYLNCSVFICSFKLLNSL